MTRQDTAPKAGKEPSSPARVNPSHRATIRFLGRNPARTEQIREQVEDERSLLWLALATFQAELASEAT